MAAGCGAHVLGQGGDGVKNVDVLGHGTSGHCYAPSLDRKLRNASQTGLFAENTRENRVHMFCVIAEVKFLFDFLDRKRCHVRVAQKVRFEIFAFFPDFHRVTLHQTIGIFAANARLGQAKERVVT